MRRIALVKIMKNDGSDYVTSKFWFDTADANVLIGSFINVSGGKHVNENLRVSEIITIEDCNRRYHRAPEYNVTACFNCASHAIGMTAAEVAAFDNKTHVSYVAYGVRPIVAVATAADAPKVALVLVVKDNRVDWVNYKFAIPAGMTVNPGDKIAVDRPSMRDKVLIVHEVITNDECAGRYSHSIMYNVVSKLPSTGFYGDLIGENPDFDPRNISDNTEVDDTAVADRKIALVKIMKSDGSDYVTSKFWADNTVNVGDVVKVDGGKHVDQNLLVSEVITETEFNTRYHNLPNANIIAKVSSPLCYVGMTASEVAAFDNNNMSDGNDPFTENDTDLDNVKKEAFVNAATLFARTIANLLF